MMRLRGVKRSVSSLSIQQLVKLDVWLHSLIETFKEAGGKLTKLHGPYWYAYWSEGGKTMSQYICRKASNLPEILSHTTSDNSYVIHLPR